jgi:hypothetical protein
MSINLILKGSLIKKIWRFINPRFRTIFLEYDYDFNPRYGYSKPAHSELCRIINYEREAYKKLLAIFLNYKEDIWLINDIKEEKDNLLPVWNSGYMPGLDILALYAIVAEFKPSRVIEIGCGYSSKVFNKARMDHNLQFKLVSIDPQPRAEIRGISDRMICSPLQELGQELFDELGENDILFVDSTHRILPGSDTTVLFLEILPLLKKGVIVHFHDIYLPYDYPPFMCERFYSEQYGLAAIMLANPGLFKPIFPSWFVSEDKELSEIIAPVWDNPKLKNIEKHGCSFWFRKTT